MVSRHIATSFTLALAVGGALIGASVSGCSSSKSSGDQVAQGQQAVSQFKCTSCHGADLGGDIKAQPMSKAYPANITPDSETGIGDWDNATIANAILNAIDDEGKTLCVMPKFATMGMTADQANSIAAYLKSIPAVSRMIPESDCGASGTGGAGGTGGAAGGGVGGK